MQETLDLSDHSLLKSQPKNKVKVVDRKERKKEDNKDMGRRQEKYKREQEREAELLFFSQSQQRKCHLEAEASRH